MYSYNFLKKRTNHLMSSNSHPRRPHIKQNYILKITKSCNSIVTFDGDHVIMLVPDVYKRLFVHLHVYELVLIGI